MTLTADKVSQNKLMSIVYVFLHHLDHTPTSDIRDLQPRRNQKFVISRSLSSVVTVAERCAMCITKTDYIDRVYYVRKSHKTTKWLETNCIPANRAPRTSWFKKLQTRPHLHNVFLQLNRSLLLETTVAQKKITLFMKPGGSSQSS